ncbi:HGxxPAAW family protein [Demequina capsici]|uniref:HGxxPAAW family protein n=1 Tax=Demequina capsici TaxID=3075620 RepID=A0AA96FD12_9MICO|nr:MULTISPECIES: HGxxPAAW family protein [unclassified Demequina]WNM23181.1 HGxxPAAW family protein [Demequina sp. OYTSA14]WNM26060.1 HGxxPAAW family protein [Demequina sp. PMTSA13]
MSSSVKLSPQDLPEAAPHNHGRTLAAWVTNVGLVLAALVASLGIGIPQISLVWVGAALAVVSLAAGGALKALGHGQTAS